MSAISVSASGPFSREEEPQVREGQPVTCRIRGPKPTSPARRGTGCSSKPLPLPAGPGGAIPPGPAAAGAGLGAQAKAWTLFWQEQGAASRCLADARPDVRYLLNDHWAALAATLAPASRILDVGCGAGAVGRALLAARPGLRITGIDLAGVPAPGDRRIALLPGTPMEELPFGTGSFDAAVSQFGIEYGDIRAAAAELARVLRPGAPFSCVVHHAGSSVVRRSLARSRALAGLLGEPVRRAFLAADAVELDRQIWPVRRAAPGEAIVAEVAQALRGRLTRGAAERAAIWDAVAAALAPEREILAALEVSCVAPEQLGPWLAGLAGRFDPCNASVMRRPDGEVIAWRVEGRSAVGRSS